MIRSALFAPIALCALSLSAQAQDASFGAFVTSDGWAVTNTRALADCDGSFSSEYGLATDVIEDASHNVRLIKFDADRVRALRLDATAGPRTTVSAITVIEDLRNIEVERIRLDALYSDNGDASYVTADYVRTARNQTHFVLDDDARLVGVLSRWTNRGQRAEITKGSYMALLLASHGHAVDVSRPARRIQQSLVEISCADAALDPIEPDFNAATLDAFGPDAWANAFVQLNQQSWSSPNTSALEFVELVYGNRTEYFGSTYTKAQVMRDKTNFANRWDFRSYAIRQDDLNIQCGRDVCSVAGVNDYHTYSSSLQRTSSGVAEFSFDLDLDTLTISRENSSVLQRGGADTNGMKADWAAATRVCAQGDPVSCERSDYLERVMEAFDLCVIPRRPRGNLSDIGGC